MFYATNISLQIYLTPSKWYGRSLCPGVGSLSAVTIRRCYLNKFLNPTFKSHLHAPNILRQDKSRLSNFLQRKGIYKSHQNLIKEVLY